MIRVANAPCSWGIIENIEGERYDYVRVLNEIKETGYAGTELGDWGFMPTDPVTLDNALRSRKLDLLASWVSVYLHDVDRYTESETDAVRTAELLAAASGKQAFIVLGNDPYTDLVRTKNAGRITPEHSMRGSQWEVFADSANRLAHAIMEQTGLRTVFHHHIGTWVETPEETEKLLEMTDPELLGLCFDTGHWCFGGGDPIAGIRQHQDRIWYVHFKDCEPNIASRSREQGWDGVTSVSKGVFCELGKGEVDFPAVLQTLKDIHYEGWIVVEQDIIPGLGTPKESAQRNRHYLHSLGI